MCIQGFKIYSIFKIAYKQIVFPKFMGPMWTNFCPPYLYNKHIFVSLPGLIKNCLQRHLQHVCSFCHSESEAWDSNIFRYFVLLLLLRGL